MIRFDRISRSLAVVITAALIGAAGLSAFGRPSVSAAPALEEGLRDLSVRTQAEDQPSVEQVGEGEDTETLDEGAPPAQQESDDVETLDQGTPPATEPVPATVVDSIAPPADTAAAPVTTTTTDSGAVYPAPASQQATGPTLPPGFGTGRVRVSAGRFGFPVGLEECHVGAVTGRAYVGIDCGEDEGDVVGHAPSFEDFPFVLEAEFPFESSDAFFSDPFFTDRDDADGGDGGDVVVSTARPARSNASDSKSESGSGSGSNSGNAAATGNGSVELTQRSRDRGPRVRGIHGAGDSQTKKQRAKSNKSNTSVESNNGGESNSESRAKRQSMDAKQSVKGNNKNKNNGKDKKAKGSKKKRDKRKSGKKN